jgi:hypothetical protein
MAAKDGTTAGLLATETGRRRVIQRCSMAT